MTSTVCILTAAVILAYAAGFATALEYNGPAMFCTLGSLILLALVLWPEDDNRGRLL